MHYFNANSMHYFSQIHCITSITLNYSLTEISLLKTNCRVLNPQQEDDPMKGLSDRQDYLS